MKKLLTLFISVALGGLVAYGQSSASGTYSSGNISTNYGYYSSSCNAGNTITVSVPAGSLVVGVDVSYNMVAQSGAWMGEQRSRISCTTTGNTEPSYYSGSGYGGTYGYNRTDLDIANGISTGSYTFAMQSYRTWGSYGGCGTYYQQIPSNTWSVTVYYCSATPTYTPILSTDTVLGTCGADSIVVTANGNYSSFLWSNGSTDSITSLFASGEYSVEATDAGGCPYSDTLTASLIKPNVYPADTSICIGFGDSVEMNALYTAPASCMTMPGFEESNNTVVDHNSYSGDDRGGIAITPDYFYYVGDNNTVRYNAEDMSSPTSLPQRDGIFSDLGNGQLYTFWDTVDNGFANSSTYYNTINAIRMMNTSLGYGTIIGLSQEISAGYTSFIAAGTGYVILWANNNDTFYHIDLMDGTVTNLGTGNLTSYSNPGVYYQSAENWSRWGIAECDGAGNYSIIGRAYYHNGSYVAGYSTPTRFVRWNISTGSNELVSTLSSGASDMACITYSRWHQRWYFHHESSSATFGGGSETAGYADVTGAGTSPFVFSWSTGDSTQSIRVHPTSTTTYYVDITDGIQTCSDSATVNVDPVPVISITENNIACNGDSTGSINATASGSSSPYMYMWSNGDSTASIVDLGGGMYYLTVTDDNGCMSMDTAEVTQPLVPFTPILANVMDLNCFGDNSGSGTVLPAGGDGPYTYAWSTGGTSASETSLAAGAVSVTVTDANGCERILSDSLDQPDEFFANLGMTVTTCSGDEDGTASSNATGGTEPYSYSWGSGGSDSSISGISSGYQNLTVTDANGCVYVDSVDVAFQFASPVVPVGPVDTMCNGFTYVLDAGSDGSMYEWSTGDSTQTITISTSGLYDVTVTNNDGCATEATTLVVKKTCVTGVSSIAGEELSVNIFPNPTDGIINLEVKGDLTDALDLAILDLSGRVVWSKASAVAPNGLQSIDLSNHAAGTYFLRMTQENQVVNVTPVTIK
ncbi:MAG: T9SS type A sorting domain-containing protein [Flavobacteriales bacterium]|nr:T9SS type A sorting domain-containing protein [Flavobacteriales bacterium]